MTKYDNLVIVDNAYAMIESALEDFLQTPQDHAQRLKFNRILEAAQSLFERHGYRKTSMSDVASEAGIAKGTVYLYFRSKSDLLLHAIAREKAGYLEEMAAVFDDSLTPAESLKAFVRLSIVLSRKMPLTARLLNGDREIGLVLSEMDSNLLTPGRQLELAMVGDMLSAAAAPHDWSEQELQERAVLFINLLFTGILGDQLFRQDVDLAGFADMMADTLVDGIAHRG